MRFILPFILIAISITGFIWKINPTYLTVQDSKTKLGQYDTALNNSKTFAAQREILDNKYKSISAVDLSKLSTMLPDSVDNIRLILEIDNIASAYGMSLKDVQYNTTPVVPASTSATPTPTSTNTNTTTASSTQNVLIPANTKQQKDFGSWDLEFSTQGTYQNFLSFLNDLEHNLRIVDVVSVDFSSDSPKSSIQGISPDPNSTQNYKYNFKIRTYWLKN